MEQRVAREWLWLVGSFFAMALISVEAGVRDLTEAAKVTGIFYAVTVAVRLTIWAIKKIA